MAALEEKLTSNKSSSDGAPFTIKTTHFELAVTKISPSVNVKVLLLLPFLLLLLLFYIINIMHKMYGQYEFVLFIFQLPLIACPFGKQQKQYYKVLSESFKAV